MFCTSTHITQKASRRLFSSVFGLQNEKCASHSLFFEVIVATPRNHLSHFTLFEYLYAYWGPERRGALWVSFAAGVFLTMARIFFLYYKTNSLIKAVSDRIIKRVHIFGLRYVICFLQLYILLYYIIQILILFLYIL